MGAIHSTRANPFAPTPASMSDTSTVNQRWLELLEDKWWAWWGFRIYICLTHSLMSLGEWMRAWPTWLKVLFLSKHNLFIFRRTLFKDGTCAPVKERVLLPHSFEGGNGISLTVFTEHQVECIGKKIMHLIANQKPEQQFFVCLKVVIYLSNLK